SEVARGEADLLDSASSVLRVRVVSAFHDGGLHPQVSGRLPTVPDGAGSLREETPPGSVIPRFVRRQLQPELGEVEVGQPSLRRAGQRAKLREAAAQDRERREVVPGLSEEGKAANVDEVIVGDSELLVARKERLDVTPTAIVLVPEVRVARRDERVFARHPREE